MNNSQKNNHPRIFDNDSSPKIKKMASVVLAIRDEEAYIGKCLDSLLAQQIPSDEYEIIVVDGISSDRTKQIVSGYIDKHPKTIRMLDNPRKTQANGRNIGIRNADSNIIVIFSGHACADRLFLSTLVQLLRQSPDQVACVGGIFVAAPDETIRGAVMADVQSTLLGGGGTTFRSSGSNKYVDTVTFCAYKRNILEAVGLYDERFDIGEDVELNWRIREAGYKLLLSNDAVVYYYRRHGTLKLFCRRMFAYGFWRALVTLKHPRSFKIIFLFPIIIFLAIIILPFFILFSNILSPFIIAAITAYLVSVIVSSAILSVKHKKLSYFFLGLAIYVVEHFSIGLGFIVGLLKGLPAE